MAILTKPSAEARVALIYITGGALLDVWSGVWYFYMRASPPTTVVPYYLCAGFFLTGLILMLIGFGVGHIGRAARRAELPPPEATPDKVLPDQVAPNPAANRPAVPLTSTEAVAAPAAPAVPLVTASPNSIPVRKP
jgi:hypothetical protein